MNNLLRKATKLLLGLSLAAGVGVAIGSKAAERADATDLTFSNIGSSLSTTAVTTETSFTLNSTYGFKYNNGKKQGSALFLTSGTGYFYNTTAMPGDISSITVTTNSGSAAACSYNVAFKNGAITGKYTTSSINYVIGAGASHEYTNSVSGARYFCLSVTSKNGQVLSFTVNYSTGGTTTYSVTYDANGATSGSVPTDSTSYASGATVTVKGNTGNLAKTGYVFGGWNTLANGTGTNYAAGTGTFTITAATTLYAKWNADTLNYLSISGSMTKTSYKDGDAWSSAGFTVTANYASGATPDVTSSVTWSYYVGGASQATANLGDTSVVVRATFGGKYVESSAQSVTVVAGVTYDLSKIDGFSSWATSYGAHNLTQASFSPAVSTAATLNFLITNKQSSGIGSTYPCIGAKTNSEETCLTFTLNESGKKITSVDITFVTRYTSTYPSLYLHKGNGIATTPLDSLTMSGSAGDEHVLSCSDLNDTVFTVGYNAHQTGSNGAVGIKSISIGLANQAAFGTLDHISVTGLPNTVYHIGETYDSTGFVVTAFDGASEATANFKDVTASVTTDFDGGYTFADSDVPGFDCEVSYSGDGGSDTTSFHVDVYALAEYELVTSTLADWSGEYLIVGTNSEDDLCAMNGALSNPDTEHGYKVVSATAGVIEAGQELEWTVAPTTGGYSIQGKSGKYIGSLAAKSNGMLVDDSALVNTFSISGSDVSIAGTNTYNLTLNTTGDRFRYYASGSVQLYRLKESSNAIAYAETFLAAFTCDASGESAPTFTIKEGSTYWSWSLLATEYNTLTAVEKEEFRLGVASESGDEIAQALARYDYVVGKYGTATYSDFMSRNPAQIGGVKLALGAVNENTNTIAIIVIISLVSVTAIGGYFFIKRREQN